jgi:hypothetical protein
VLPFVSAAWRLGWPVGLIALTPSAKDRARWLARRVAATQAAPVRWLLGQLLAIRRGVDNVLPHTRIVLAVVVPVAAAAAVALQRGPMTRLLASKALLAGIWTAEVVIRRNSPGLAYGTVTVYTLSIVLCVRRFSVQLCLSPSPYARARCARVPRRVRALRMPRACAYIFV